MISYQEAVRQIDMERARMRYAEFDTIFVQGMLQGLALSCTILKKIWIETKDRPHHNPLGKRRKAA